MKNYFKFAPGFLIILGLIVFFGINAKPVLAAGNANPTTVGPATCSDAYGACGTVYNYASNLGCSWNAGDGTGTCSASAGLSGGPSYTVTFNSADSLYYSGVGISTYMGNVTGDATFQYYSPGGTPTLTAFGTNPGLSQPDPSNCGNSSYEGFGYDGTPPGPATGFRISGSYSELDATGNGATFSSIESFNETICLSSAPNGKTYKATSNGVCTLQASSPPTATLSANPTSVVSGGTSTIGWTITNATSCTDLNADMPSGNWSSGNNGSGLTAALTSTKTYQIKCTDSVGQSVTSNSVTVTVTAPTGTITVSPNPSMYCSGSANPAETFTVSSNVQTEIFVNGTLWTGYQGPNYNQTLSTSADWGNINGYVFSIKDSAGTTLDSVTVNTNNTGCPDFSISVSPGTQTVTQGGSTSYTVTLQSVNSFSGSVALTNPSGCPTNSTCSFSPSTVSVPSNSSAASTFIISTTASTPAAAYNNIMVTGTSGSLNHSATTQLIVTASPTGTITVSPNPSMYCSGSANPAETFTVSSNVQTEIFVNGTLWTGYQGPNYNQTLSTSADWGNINGYVFSIKDSAGTTLDSVTVNTNNSGCSSPPTATLSANPTSVVSGGTSTIGWTITNATSCTDLNADMPSGNWSSGNNGSGLTAALTSTKTYQIKCTDSVGQSVTSNSVTVTVTAPTGTITVSPNPSMYCSGSANPAETFTVSSNVQTEIFVNGTLWTGYQGPNYNQTLSTSADWGNINGYVFSIKDSAGTTLDSVTVNTNNTGCPASPPSPPGGGTITAVSNPSICPATGIQLSWTAGSGDNTYTIDRNTNNSQSGATQIVSGLSSLSYTDSSGSAGTTYYYWVEGYNTASGLYSSWSAANTNSSGGLQYNTCTALAPIISLNPTSMTFTAVSGGATPAGQTLTVKNTGTATLNWSWTTVGGGSWCSYSAPAGPNSLAVGASVSYTVSVAAPSNIGSFSNCNIQVSDPSATNSPQVDNLTYNVSSAVCPASGNSVNLASSSIVAGNSTTASAPANFSGGTYNSSNTGVATVSGSTINGLSAGTSSITGSGWSYANGNTHAASCGLSGSTLTVTPSSALAPIISLNPTSMTFTAVSGGATPAGQTLTVKNTGTATLNWSWTTVGGGSWCSYSAPAGPNSLAVGASVSYTVSVAAPSNIGSFSNCNIQVSDPSATNSPQVDNLTYNVSSAVCPASGNSVNLASSSIVAGNSTTASAPANFSGGTYNSSNTGVATVSGSTINGLSAGTSSITGSGWSYANGNTHAASCGLSGSTLTVTPSSALAPIISLNPTSMTFTAVSGGATPAGQTLTVKNTGTATLNWSWTTVGGGSWCSYSAPAGPNSLAVGASVSYTVSVAAPSNIGSFSNCNIQVSDPSATNSPQVDNLTYNVSSAVCPASGNSVNLASSSIVAGNSTTASAPANFSGGTYNSSNTGVATVSGSTINGLSAGTSSITGSGWSYANGNTHAASCGLSGSTLTVTGGVGSPPTASLSASSGTVASGGTVTINWTIANANLGCADVNNNMPTGGDWSSGITGSGLTAPIFSTQTYQISCSGSGGGPILSNAVSVNVTGGGAGSPNPVTSNKDIIQINNGATLAFNPCNEITNALPSSQVLEQGDILTFELNLCNTGNATATLTSIIDSMTNLQEPSGGWDIQFYNYNHQLIGGVSATASGPSTSPVLTFTGISGQQIPWPSSSQPVYDYITYQAELITPTGTTGSTSRFANSFDFNYSYGSGGVNSGSSGNISTGYLPFYIGNTSPIIQEVP